MPTISFPRTFGNLTTGQATYLDDNFNAINSWLLGGNIDNTMVNIPNLNTNLAPSHVTADGNPRTISVTPGADVVPVADATGKIPIGYMPSGLTAGNLVWDSVAQGITYPTTTVTINTPLTGIVHGGYRFEFNIINSTGGASAYRLYYNNDTTNSNYNYYGSTSSNGEALIFNSGVNNDTQIVGVGFISVFPTDSTHFMITTHCLIRTFTASTRVAISAPISWWHNSTSSILNSTDLNRIDITASAANGICANSRFRLWRQT